MYSLWFIYYYILIYIVKYKDQGKIIATKKIFVRAQFDTGKQPLRVGCSYFPEFVNMNEYARDRSPNYRCFRSRIGVSYMKWCPTAIYGELDLSNFLLYIFPFLISS